MHRRVQLLDIPITGLPTTPSGAAWLDAGLQVQADTPLTHLEQVSVALLVTGQAHWFGIVQAGYARVQRETGLNDAEVAAREDALFRRWSPPTLTHTCGRRWTLGSSSTKVTRSGSGWPAAWTESPPTSSPPGVATTTNRTRGRGWTTTGSPKTAASGRAKKAVTAAEKTLRDARRLGRLAPREARERLRRTGQG